VASHGLSVKVAVEVAQGTLAPPVPESAGGGEAAPRRRRRRRPTLEIGAGEPPWRVIVDLMAHVVVVLDGRGSILEANAAAARALGVPGERLPGRRLLPFLDRADLPRARAALQAPFHRRMDWQLRLRNLARPLSVDCLPFSYHGQARLAIIGRGRQDPEARAG
jgi:PAS domain-containing protein